MIKKIETLKEASEHIWYEVNKIFENYDYFKNNLDDYTQVRIENFLLHFRNLFDFFYPSETIYRDNMCVYDFIDNYEEFDNKKIVEKDLDVKGKINKYLSHITYTRCSSEFPKWQIEKIMEGTVKTVEAFYDALPEDYREWNYVKEIDKLVKGFKDKHKKNTMIKKEIMVGTTSTDSGVSTSEPRKLS